MVRRRRLAIPARQTQPAATAAPTKASADSRPVQLRVLAAESRFRNETRNLHRRERDRFGNFLWNMMRLDFGPRVSLEELVGENQDKSMGMKQELDLSQSLDYYATKEDNTKLVEVLKFYIAYLMQEARHCTDFNQQVFLLFKTIDLARMTIQYSPYAVNQDGEAIVFGVLGDLNEQKKGIFSRYFAPEQDIYAHVRRLATLPSDIQLRFRLAELLLGQTSYFDALMQLQMILRIHPIRRGGNDRIHGHVFSRLGDVFLSAAGDENIPLRDGRKLRTFIERYNRDFAPKGGELPILDRADPQKLDQVRRALRKEAATWWARAIENHNLKPQQRVKLAMETGKILVGNGEFKSASELLERCYPLWRGVIMKNDVLSDKVEFLRTLAIAAGKSDRREQERWANEELKSLMTRLEEVNKKEAERIARLEELFGVEEEEEQV
ncbi:MAG: hypothetical protein OEZ59_05600 [Deltaproteobacteria bacterium]|nr:hypothetical protein [Deltaproteobacteria bacterium]